MALTDGIRFFAATDVGRVRDHNEDNYLVDKKLALFVVADGMGGHAAGEVASALAVRTVHEEIRKQRQLIDDFEMGAKGASAVSAREVLNLLEFAVQRACARIHEEAVADPHKRGMGTTLSAMIFVGDKGFIAHVGDSRIYLYRDGRVQQLTEDHTVFNELIKRGKLTREQIEKVAHKNAITRAVGVYERVEVDTLAVEVLPGDAFLLCSDGLHGYFDDKNEDVLGVFKRVRVEDQAQAFIEHANARGGKDNITNIIVRVEANDQELVRARKLQAKRDILAKMSLFSRLSERELLRVMQVAEIRDFARGSHVMREGEKGDELFIVLSGKVAVIRGEAVLTHLGPGEHVGEMALIRAVPRSANVVADVDSELVAIKRGDFFDILRREHELAIKFLWQFLGVLADRLDQTSRELRTAREHEAVEDITSEIFPEIDDDSPTGPHERIA
jgi:serine/threonine protein phosphatase PrpC